jgi:hypothetical protein
LGKYLFNSENFFFSRFDSIFGIFFFSVIVIVLFLCDFEIFLQGFLFFLIFVLFSSDFLYPVFKPFLFFSPFLLVCQFFRVYVPPSKAFSDFLLPLQIIYLHASLSLFSSSAHSTRHFYQISIECDNPVSLLAECDFRGRVEFFTDKCVSELTIESYSEFFFFNFNHIKKSSRTCRNLKITIHLPAPLFSHSVQRNKSCSSYSFPFQKF